MSRNQSHSELNNAQTSFSTSSKELGSKLSSYYRSCPYFFTPEGATLSMVGMYRGASAFLIGCGPSFSEIDHSKLKHIWSMTLNNSAHTFRSNANCSVDEPSRFNYSMWLDPIVQKFVPMASFDAPLWDNRLLSHGNKMIHQWKPADRKLADCPNVVGFRRNEVFNPSTFLHEDTINWGNHKNRSGRRSVMLSALRILFLLGFRNVYLLGVDFEMRQDKAYHFPQAREQSVVRENMATYFQLQKWFTELQPYFLAERFMVNNCNPKSKLEVFPFVALDKALEQANSGLGNYKDENTDGMYCNYNAKLRIQSSST